MPRDLFRLADSKELKSCLQASNPLLSATGLNNSKGRFFNSPAKRLYRNELRLFSVSPIKQLSTSVDGFFLKEIKVCQVLDVKGCYAKCCSNDHAKSRCVDNSSSRLLGSNTPGLGNVCTNSFYHVFGSLALPKLELLL